MPRNIKLDNTAFHATYSKNSDLAPVKLNTFMERGAIPEEFLGVTKKEYGSNFGAVAHGVEQKNRMNRLLNNGVDDEIYFVVSTRDAEGKIVQKTDAVRIGDKTYHPNERGMIRITDQAKVDMLAEIAAYRKQRTDKLMDIVRLGDDIAQYVLGLSKKQWDDMCKANGTLPVGLTIHKDLLKVDCSLEYINSLPPSMTQTQSVAKLRKIVEFYEKNVNLENLSTVSEKKEMDSDKYLPYNRHYDSAPAASGGAGAAATSSEP